MRRAAPLSSDLRDFPDHTFERTWSNYPFGGNSLRRFTFQKFITRSRSFCLRVSGAVAPSAASSRSALPRGIVCAGHPHSAVRRTGMLQSIIRGAGMESTKAVKRPGSPRTYSHFAPLPIGKTTFSPGLRCPAGPKPRSGRPEPGRTGPAGRPGALSRPPTGHGARHRSG